MALVAEREVPVGPITLTQAGYYMRDGRRVRLTRYIEIDEGVILDDLDGLLVLVDDEWNVDVATGQPHAWDVDPASGGLRPWLGVVRVPFRARGDLRTAVNEVGHVLGIGTAPRYLELVHEALGPGNRWFFVSENVGRRESKGAMSSAPGGRWLIGSPGVAAKRRPDREYGVRPRTSAQFNCNSGTGRAGASDWAMPRVRTASARDAEEEREGSVDGDDVRVVEVAEDVAEPPRTRREDLIDHDEGTCAKTILFRRFDGYPDERDVEFSAGQQRDGAR